MIISYEKKTSFCCFVVRSCILYGIAYIHILFVRTVQFDTVLRKLPVIIFKMRANTYSSKTVPRTSPHLETSIDVVHLKRHQILYSQYVDTTCLRSSMHIAFKNTHIAKRTIKINFNLYKSSTLILQAQEVQI